MSSKKPTQKEKKSLKIEILEKLSSLLTAGFGLVAALAWNDAIKAAFAHFFPKPEDNLWALLGYALFITILVVVVTIQLGRTVNLAKKQLKRRK
jgi:uncharacterized membrane protein YidH (DUF202 family)